MRSKVAWPVTTPESAHQIPCVSPANLQAKAAQNPPDAQFNVDKPPKKLFARNQQRSHLLRSSRFGVCTGRNQPIRISWASPRASLRSVFTVIAYKAAFTCRFQQNSFKSGSLQPRMQPLRQWPRLKSYRLHSKTKRLKESNQSCRLAQDLRLLHNLTLRVHNANLDRSNDTSIPA
jgi:hypothetical protein